MPNITNSNPFDSIRHVDEEGFEFWLARELMVVMGYPKWQHFEQPINQAIENLELNGDNISDHFLRSSVKKDGETRGRVGKDYKLSRYACYMVALCCDGRKTEVATAKKYFAIKTREAEVAIPQLNDRLRELELQLELAKTQERLSINQHKLLATVHLLETISPGLAPLALGNPSAVVERTEYIERVITPDGEAHEGVGITHIQRRLGFKTTKQAWAWLGE
ncbi:hypothetical protein PCC6912_50670 [Chlorogloeopsis fritschii PCC 6912]|uniref:Bro-N domain-containing protein n=1 Tax=Chlorogloeopsis fritschii PCC 6912 TaxID=211165 RepID=A0A3S0XQX1_CHLFR|nr:hypothetical protein [Chlorogloeopsis fritschii]RUR74889.1 hypothetical protein PCC6912_50670 [Chlorogloeopsis fritschii PCC 6912]